MLLPHEQSVIYFVTICVADRKPVLTNDGAFNAFKIATSKLKNWKVLAAVLMPDHLHLIVTPTEDRDARIGDFSAALKRWMREEIQKDGKRSACPTIQKRVVGIAKRKLFLADRREGVVEDVVGYVAALGDRLGFVERPVDAEINPALAVFFFRLR